MATGTSNHSKDVSLSSLGPDETILRLPHPYQTEYALQPTTPLEPSPRRELAGVSLYRIREKPGSCRAPTPCKLTSDHLLFSEPQHLKSSELPPLANNSAWARARRSQCSLIVWDGLGAPPSPAQAWLLLYILYTLRPATESLRLELRGHGAATLAQQLIDLLLATPHAPQSRTADAAALLPTKPDEALVVASRGTFWQGAGCPFGPRPVWLPEGSPRSLLSSDASRLYPIAPLQHTITVASAGDPQDPDRRQQSYHTVRPAKPAPGSLIYSRWVPHLKETFSMVVLDWENKEHLDLLHGWMNDPRVSQSWHEEGTLEHHRQYLRTIHQDPHQMAVLARWDDTFFAYFEIYWAKEDRLGGYYDAGDFDRGRHVLVCDVRFRGPHRVSGWWSSKVHYMFLDEPRTMNVVGEPGVSVPTSSLYDLIHGFRVDQFVDLPHKRSTINSCSRAKFF